MLFGSTAHTGILLAFHEVLSYKRRKLVLQHGWKVFLCCGKVWTLPSTSRGKSSEFQEGTQGDTKIGAEAMRPSEARIGGRGIGGREEEARRTGEGVR